MMFIIHFSHYSRLDKWSLNLLFTVFRIFLKAFEKFKCKSKFFFFFLVKLFCLGRHYV